MIGEDYLGPSTVAAEFMLGVNVNIGSCIQVDILDDDVFESPQTFNADIEGSTVGMLDIGTPNTATVEILDPEGIIILYRLFRIS